MTDDINKHRLQVCENISKAIEIGFTGSDDLEKSHSEGDIHSNGKWVWTKLPSGNFDWRVIKKKEQVGNDENKNVNNDEDKIINTMVRRLSSGGQINDRKDFYKNKNGRWEMYYKYRPNYAVQSPNEMTEKIAKKHGWFNTKKEMMDKLDKYELDKKNYIRTHRKEIDDMIAELQHKQDKSAYPKVLDINTIIDDYYEKNVIDKKK